MLVATPSTRGLGQRAVQPAQRRRPVGAVRDHLGQHRVVVAADDACRSTSAGVDPHAGTRAARAARAPGRRWAGTRAAGILRVDPGLDRVPASAAMSSWRNGSFSPAATRSCRSTRSSPVTISVTGCSTCSRVFISMKKNSSGRSADDDELDRARAGVVDAARGVARPPRPIARPRRPAVEQRRRRLLDDLLVAPLQAALALAEVHDVAVRVGEHLDLDVPRARDTNRSRSSVSSPNAARGLPAGAGDARRAGPAGSCTTRMPLPPPPADGLTSTG